MTLANEYARQYGWRCWPQAYDMLPPLAGARVLDLGCAIGDQARDLAARGAEVVGVDGDESLVAHARTRDIAGAMFEHGDIRSPAVEGPFHGIWASFVPAYFPDLRPVLAGWARLLRPGGWIALTEVAGMFDHEPLPEGARALLDGYASDALAAGRYDFDMGSKLAAHLTAAGFEVRTACVLPDCELSFTGAAQPDVQQAWRQRFERMRPLRERAAQVHPSLQEDFLRCIASARHMTTCTVRFCLATSPSVLRVSP